MNHANKGKANFFLIQLSATLIILLTICINSFGFMAGKFHIHLTAPAQNRGEVLIQNKSFGILSFTRATFQDTIPSKNDSVNLLRSDTTTVPVVDSFSFKVAKGALDAPVSYHADDSLVMYVPEKKIKLYGKKSTVIFDENELEAPSIEYNQATNLVTAHHVKDSTGKVIAGASFKQKDFTSASDTIVFNMKTQKGLTKGTYTQQGEMYVYGEKIKKVNDSVFYALRGRFTTCNLDTPHFAFVSEKVKLINKKMAFTGPVHPEFEGVPVPIILPFGIYPLTQGRHSGFIFPSFSANDQMGIAMEGLGYYKILSDNWDVITRGTLYSYGGWTFNVSPRYYKRYRFQGNFGLDVQRFKTNFKGDPDYSSNQTYHINWTHNSDNKARPGVTFRANVDAGSSKFNSQVPNSPIRNFSNRLNSSISYGKVWKDKPYNLSVNANHNQNTNTGLINLNLPDINFNVNTIYPFRRKEPIGETKWFENMGVALNTTAKSLTSFYDTAGQIFTQIKDNLQWGASHNVPISLSLPQLGPFQIAPGVTYQERWYQRQERLVWDTANKKLDTLVNEGFFRANEMTFSLGLNTRIFGLFTFNKGRVTAIRHEIRPFINFNYKPDLNGKDWYSVRRDTFSTRTERHSIYERSVYGAFNEGKFGGLSFGIDNNLSMKVRDRKDTSAEAIKKVSLLDGLSISSGYNFLRDSFKFDQINVSARSNLFDKINITASALFDPYQTDSLGDRVDQLIWKKQPLSLGTLLSGNVSLQTSFSGGDKTKKKEPQGPDLTRQNYNNTGLPLDEYQQELQYIQNNPGEFVDFSIPWNISLNYSLRFGRIRRNSAEGFTTEFNQDVNWNSSLNLTPKWKIGLNGFYNITRQELGTISMYLSREMHCWQMAINISPVGKFKFFNITISPKSGLLRDLRINRTRSFVDL